MKPFKRAELTKEESDKIKLALDAELIFSDDFAERVRRKEEKERLREHYKKNSIKIEELSGIFSDKIPERKIPVPLSEGFTLGTRKINENKNK